MSDHYHIDPWSHTHSFSSLPVYGVGGTVRAANQSVLDRMTEIATQHYKSTISEQLYGAPKQKEPEMTTLEKIRRERQEAREREKIEQMYTDYDEFDVDGLEDGIVLRFTWTPEESEKSYEYAALKAAGRWYVTGRESPNGLAGEDFVAWLIGKDVFVADLIELVAA